jgi:hypothetical protein
MNGFTTGITLVRTGAEVLEHTPARLRVRVHEARSQLEKLVDAPAQPGVVAQKRVQVPAAVARARRAVVVDFVAPGQPLPGAPARGHQPLQAVPLCLNNHLTLSYD